MTDMIWRLDRGDGPLVAVALHDAHAVRAEVGNLLALDDSARLREEDPYTGPWTAVAPTRVVALRSRFEVDLNRPRQGAVYREPKDAWGLDLWRTPLPDPIATRSLEEYDHFYEAMGDLFRTLERAHGRFIVFDLHSYNHRRDGPDQPAADPAGNPAVNLGTGTLDRERWGPLVDRFLTDLRAFPFPGGALDVRENVRFRGGHFSRWAHETFPDSACVLAIEFKKFFMDEWSGEVHPDIAAGIGEALRVAAAGVLDELERM